MSQSHPLPSARTDPSRLKTQPRLSARPRPCPALGTWSYPDDGEQLVAVDASVAVHVIELEVPAQLLFHLPLEDQAQRRHVLHEVDVAVLGGGAWPPEPVCLGPAPAPPPEPPGARETLSPAPSAPTCLCLLDVLHSPS